MTASVSSTPVPSFSKRARLRMRSKMDASSALSVFGGGGACAPAFAMERKTERAIRRRTTRSDILQFLYAVASVKSNQGTGWVWQESFGWLLWQCFVSELLRGLRPLRR